MEVVDKFFKRLACDKEYYILWIRVRMQSLDCLLSNGLDLAYSGLVGKGQLPSLQNYQTLREALHNCELEFEEDSAVITYRLKLLDGVTLKQTFRLEPKKFSKRQFFNLAVQLGQALASSESKKTEPVEQRVKQEDKLTKEKKLRLSPERHEKRKVQLLMPNMRKRKAKGAKIGTCYQ